MRAVDLFCGCGGLSLGFLKAGIDVVAGVDVWQDALAVYRNNFNHPAIRLDLTNISLSVAVIRRFSPDMIIGGPPCQDFSSAGKRDENNGRGDLTVSYANIISEVKPEWFVMENVERILKASKLQEAIGIFRTAGYGLTWTVLNAALCGVPQKRKRFVLIGRLGSADDFMKSTLQNGLSDNEMSLRDYFGDKLGIEYYYRHPRSYKRRGIFSIDEPSATIRGVNRPMPKGYTLHPGDPVNSLDGIRPLTTKERSMIQTFPEWFSFEGTKTDIEQMIGNAVPVNLGFYIADSILRYSNEKRMEFNLERHTRRPKQILLATLFEKLECPNMAENLCEERSISYGKKTLSNSKREPEVICASVKNLNWVSNDSGNPFVLDIGLCFPDSVDLLNLKYFIPVNDSEEKGELYNIQNVAIRRNRQQESYDTEYSIILTLSFNKKLDKPIKTDELDIWGIYKCTGISAI